MAVSEHINQAHRSQKDGDRLLTEFAQANLALLGAVLNAADDNDAFFELFEAFRKVFACDRALVLESRDDDLECIASTSDELIGWRWARKDFQNILNGQVAASGRGNEAQNLLRALSELIVPMPPFLCLPIGVHGRPAVLILMRAQGEENFGESSIAIARQCAAVAFAALAARKGDKLDAEISRLKQLVEKLRQGEQNAQQSNKLLEEIINHLPIGVTVQDENGRFILVNAMAAANLAMPADVLTGASPADFLPNEEAAQRRQWEIDLIESGSTISTEENIKDATGERSWLTSHQPVRIVDRTVLLSSSLDITVRKQFECELAQQAHFDGLTGLPNSILVQKCVEQVLRRNENISRFALAFIDIDNFKHINDYYSPTVGDALLVQIAQRIKRRLRDSDVLGRISGDEFLLFINPVKSDDQLHVLINHILRDLKQPFHIEAFEIFTSATIGVSIYPEHGASYEALRRNADNAMYRGKRASKGGAVYFDANMGLALTARMEIEQRLRLAIRDRRFCCAFQPKVDIQTQDVVGFETLVRWRDDDGEIYPPGEFIGLAIELGLIDPITNFVLAETLNSIGRLDDAFGSGTTISINVAAKQAGDLHFMRQFVESLKASQCTDRIMLELTEDAFAAKSLFQAQVLPLLREIGVRVSIDDFGTGYSSLSALADITADEVKVDRSFISDIHRRPRNQSILHAIESLAHALGMTIIAEGVESFEELAYLQAATRIRYAQGFYFSKPLYLDEITSTRSGDSSGRIVEAARGQVEPHGSHLHRGMTGVRSQRG
jgi:diguanylate cyclase (GGDEF)-like protein/PAS domain S-box-containing protein